MTRTATKSTNAAIQFSDEATSFTLSMLDYPYGHGLAETLLETSELLRDRHAEHGDYHQYRSPA